MIQTGVVYDREVYGAPDQTHLSELYRKKVSDLAETLADPEIRTQALEIVRGLIERVSVRHDEEGVTIGFEGALILMLLFLPRTQGAAVGRLAR
ncbi:hypothetical protein ACFORG_02960 [Lutimaribacter marinistellae]|uniref:Uncharacterized protein n=1 Tax=Lutimaribacter marinistellae TaxID=1820329 RepID=A0ABV7TCG8_9RHOB